MDYLDRSTLRDLARTTGHVKPGCKIRATTDIEALERWLDEYFDKATTFRTYKKEGERFLVWCVHVRKVTLSDLLRDDVEAYVSFLRNPEPRDVWCGARRQRSADGKRLWHPFAGPLSDKAIKMAITILSSFLSFLVDANYVTHNPFALIRRKSRFTISSEEQALQVHERILTTEEWQAFLLTVRSADARARFMVSMLYFLGLRIDELAKARWHDCKRLQGKWWFFVCGKNNRLGKIPVNTELLHAIMTYRHHHDMAPLPDPLDDTPIFKSPRGELGLTSRHISTIIKSLAQKAAQQFLVGTPSHEKLKRLSPHWLRHLSASRQDLAGISLTHIKSNLRHENEQTTRIYVHAFDDERHRDMEKLTY